MTTETVNTEVKKISKPREPLTEEQKQQRKEKREANVNAKAEALSVSNALFEAGPSLFKVWIELKKKSVAYPTLRGYITKLENSVNGAASVETVTETKEGEEKEVVKVQDAKRTKQKIGILRNAINSIIDDKPILKRKEGTGTRKEIDVEYKDTPANRKKGLVGQTYKKISWENAEYVEIQRKKIKRKAIKVADGEPKPKRQPNKWNQAVVQARTEMKEKVAGKFIAIRGSLDNLKDKEGNPRDTTEQDILGNEIYLRATELHLQMKEAAVTASA